MVLSENRKARHEYILEKDIEAGIMLVGTEVRAIRDGRMSIAESYVAIKDKERRSFPPTATSMSYIAPIRNHIKNSPPLLDCPIPPNAD